MTAYHSYLSSMPPSYNQASLTRKGFPDPRKKVRDAVFNNTVGIGSGTSQDDLLFDLAQARVSGLQIHVVVACWWKHDIAGIHIVKLLLLWWRRDNPDANEDVGPRSQNAGW